MRRLKILCSLTAALLAGVLLAVDQPAISLRILAAGLLLIVAHNVVLSSLGPRSADVRRTDRSGVIDAVSTEISRAQRTGGLVTLAVISAQRLSLDTHGSRLAGICRSHDACRYDESRNELVAIALVPDKAAAKSWSDRIDAGFSDCRVMFSTALAEDAAAERMLAELNVFAGTIDEGQEIR